MSSSPISPLQIQIQRRGKPDKPGHLTVNAIGNLQVHSKSVMARQILSSDPQRVEVSIDRENSAIVIDNNSFSFNPTQLNNAESLLHEARRRSEPKSSRSPAANSVGRPPNGSGGLGSLEPWSTALVVFSFIIGALGVAGGIILALQTNETRFDTERPYLGIGLGLAANAAFFAMIGIVLGKLGQAFARSNGGQRIRSAPALLNTPPPPPPPRSTPD